MTPTEVPPPDLPEGTTVFRTQKGGHTYPKFQKLCFTIGHSDTYNPETTAAPKYPRHNTGSQTPRSHRGYQKPILDQGFNQSTELQATLVERPEKKQKPREVWRAKTSIQ